MIFFPGIILFIDIFIKFNRGYFSKGTQIKDKNEIIKNYWEKDFMFDFISFLSFIIFSDKYIYFQIISMVKIFNVFGSLSSLGEDMDLSEKKLGF